MVVFYCHSLISTRKSWIYAFFPSHLLKFCWTQIDAILVLILSKVIIWLNCTLDTTSGHFKCRPNIIFLRNTKSKVENFIQKTYFRPCYQALTKNVKTEKMQTESEYNRRISPFWKNDSCPNIVPRAKTVSNHYPKK